MKLMLIVIGVSALILAGGVWLFRGPAPDDPNVVSRSGLHWHPQLEIYVKGVKQEIPQNVGLGAVHNPIHTHEDLPIIHLEFSGVVMRDDLMLKEFFEVWSKDFMEFGSSVAMTVNGQENTERENYSMKDEDKIELRYE
jgi:hypothetical protein